VRSEDGEIVAAVGCSIDISENVRKEKELKERLDTIQEQQHIIQSLSTPILQIWDQVLTLPLFGHVDSTRASALMESLLHEVVRTRTRFAILDLTGVDVIDTATAGHLMSLIRALKLLGTEGIITGIKASIAQTVVSLGSDLSGITTLSTLQAGLQYCIEQLRAPSRSMTAASPRR
jgi:rsbT co-antagonist protein RsbR